VTLELKELLESLEQSYLSLQTLSSSIYDTQANPLQTEIINYLGENENQTVPQISHFKQCSRQNIQIVINELLTLGIIIKKTNPRHQRSVIYKLSNIGYIVFKHNKKAHDSFLGELSTNFDSQELQSATKTLNKLNEVLKK